MHAIIEHKQNTSFILVSNKIRAIIYSDRLAVPITFHGVPTDERKYRERVCWQWNQQSISRRATYIQTSTKYTVSWCLVTSLLWIDLCHEKGATYTSGCHKSDTVNIDIDYSNDVSREFCTFSTLTVISIVFSFWTGP